MNLEINPSEKGKMWKKNCKMRTQGSIVIKNKCLSEFMINEWPKCIIGD